MEKNYMKNVEEKPKTAICVSHDFFTGREKHICPWCSGKIVKKNDYERCSHCNKPLVWSD